MRDAVVDRQVVVATKKKKIDTRPIKDKLTRALARQKWEEAVEACLELREAEPKDDRNLLKLAELYTKIGQKANALEVYGALADLFAADGRLPRAISITKIIVELDPENHAVEKKLALLYARRGLPPAAAERTAADDVEKITGRIRPRPEGAAPEEKAPAPEETPPAPEAAEEPAKLPEIARAPPAPETAPAAAPPVVRRQVTPEELEAPEVLDLSVVEAGPRIPELPRTPLFSDLAPEELSAVMKRIVSHTHAREDVIVREGDAGDSVFVIAHGEVRVQVRRMDGHEVEVAGLHEGAFFGEFGMFMDGRRHATVVAASEAEVLELRQSDLQNAIFPRFPRVREVLAHFYRERALQTALAVSELFGDLPAEARAELAGLCTQEAVAEGTKVLAEGQEGPGLFLVKRGVFTVEARRGDDGSLELARLGCGDFFGEISLLQGVPVTADVRALVPGELLRFSRTDILGVCERHPEVRRAMETVKERRLHESIERLTESGLV